jgi:hypothetical protein
VIFAVVPEILSSESGHFPESRAIPGLAGATYGKPTHTRRAHHTPTHNNNNNNNNPPQRTNLTAARNTATTTTHTATKTTPHTTTTTTKTTHLTEAQHSFSFAMVNRRALW